MCTRRCCYKMGWSLSQGELVAAATFWRAQNCMTRRAGPGLPRAASTAHVFLTRPPCCQTAWSLLQGELPKLLWQGRNSTSWRAEPGFPLAALTPGAISTRRRCYKTATWLLQGDLIAATALWRARNRAGLAQGESAQLELSKPAPQVVSNNQ